MVTHTELSSPQFPLAPLLPLTLETMSSSSYIFIHFLQITLQLDFLFMCLYKVVCYEADWYMTSHLFLLNPDANTLLMFL